MTIRILIVDDDPIVRSGLTMMLNGSQNLTVVGEAADGVEAESAVTSLQPDVVLMDVRMPRQDGIITTRHVAHRTKIVVLTTFHVDDLVVQAIRAGAAGFILKDTPPASIVDAVVRVHGGEPMLSPAVTRQLMDQVARTASEETAVDALAGLSEREEEIAVEVARGLTNAEIATALLLSPATVKAHVAHIMTKLDVTNRVQIAIRVHDAGLL